MRDSASLPRLSSRHASSTRAPRRASSRAVTSPIPLLAPVTTAVRPLWSGMSLAFQPWVMDQAYGRDLLAGIGWDAFLARSSRNPSGGAHREDRDAYLVVVQAGARRQVEALLQQR